MAGFCHNYGVIVFLLSPLYIVVPPKNDCKATRDRPRLNTEARGYYTTPVAKAIGLPSMVQNISPAYPYRTWTEQFVNTVQDAVFCIQHTTAFMPYIKHLLPVSKAPTQPNEVIRSPILCSHHAPQKAVCQPTHSQNSRRVVAVTQVRLEPCQIWPFHFMYLHVFRLSREFPATDTHCSSWAHFAHLSDCSIERICKRRVDVLLALDSRQHHLTWRVRCTCMICRRPGLVMRLQSSNIVCLASLTLAIGF